MKKIKIIYKENRRSTLVFDQLQWELRVFSSGQVSEKAVEVTLLT